jgi:hypothetical protein
MTKTGVATQCCNARQSHELDHRGAFNRDFHVCSIVTERGVNRGTRHEPITLDSP